jgi:outer membrane biogenesis lipoprotein LolB
MKTNLIALTFLGLVAIFLAGCAATTDTATTTTDTRMQNAHIAH